MSDENSDINRRKPPVPPHTTKPNSKQAEALIVEYSKQEFKDKSIKRAILQHHHQQQGNHKKEGEGTQGKKTVLGEGEIVQARGGVCFQLDKTAFTGKHNHTNSKPRRKRKNTVDVNSKEEVIRRREKAKIYDRYSRNRLFNCYY